MQRFLDLFISINWSTCFRRFLRPSSGAQNCTYSVWYCQTNTAACCYRGWDGTSPDDGRRNRLKHVDQFIEINRSRKRCILLVVLWRYTCDARTCERQSHALCILAMRVASSKTWAFSLGGRYQFSAQTDHYGPGFRCYTQTVQVNADTVLHIMLHDCCSHMYSLLQLFITIPSFDSTHTYRH